MGQSTPRGLDPQDLDVIEWYVNWLKTANAALNAMDRGEDLQVILGALRLFTCNFVAVASDRYRSFDPSKFTAVVESVGDWCEGPRTGKLVRRTQSLIDIAKLLRSDRPKHRTVALRASVGSTEVSGK